MGSLVPLLMCRVLACMHICRARSPALRPIYSVRAEGCDIGHLVQGVGRKGLTSMYSNLGILAWTVALADAVAMAAPWIEASPVFTYITERSSHEVAHALISAQKLLVRLLP